MKIKVCIFYVLISIGGVIGIGCNNAIKNEHAVGEMEFDSTNTQNIEQNQHEVQDTENDDFPPTIINDWLSIGIDQKAVISKLGTPDSVSPKKYWESIGSYVYSMYYDTLGYVFEIEQYEKNPSKIFSIKFTKSCKAELPNGIRIGSKRSDLINTYKKLIDNTNSTPSKILVGSLYNGILFTMEQDKVMEIFIGALAE